MTRGERLTYHGMTLELPKLTPAQRLTESLPTGAKWYEAGDEDTFIAYIAKFSKRRLNKADKADFETRPRSLKELGEMARAVGVHAFRERSWWLYTRDEYLDYRPPLGYAPSRDSRGPGARSAPAFHFTAPVFAPRGWKEKPGARYPWDATWWLRCTGGNGGVEDGHGSYHFTVWCFDVPEVTREWVNMRRDWQAARRAEESARGIVKEEAELASRRVWDNHKEKLDALSAKTRETEAIVVDALKRLGGARS